MARVARRLIAIVAVAWSVSLVTFVVARVIPADPAQMAAGLEAGPARVQQLRVLMGLDKPILVQYIRWLEGLLRGDLGTSLRTQRPVTRDLADALPATIELTIAAMCIALATGIPMGALAAVRRGRFADAVVRFVAMSGVAFPVFWVALIAQLVFYRVLGWLPAGSRIGQDVLAPTNITGLYILDSILTLNGGALISALHHIVLPASILAFGRWATIVRMTRVSLLEVLNEDYIRTARAKGSGQKSILFHHALRNALLPVITMVGLQVGYLLSGAVLVEWVFSWPGVGDYAVRSIVTLDFNPIVAVAMVLSLVFVVINSLVDILYGILDPRVRVQPSQ